MRIKEISLRLQNLYFISFPGVYRAFVVWCVDHFLNNSDANYFSELYLYLMLFTSLVGYPCAAVHMETKKNISLKSLVYIILSSSVIVVIASKMLNPNYTGYWFLSVFLATFFCSLFEVFRQNILNNKTVNGFFIITLPSYLSFGLMIYFGLNSIFTLLVLAFAIPCFISFFFYKASSEKDSYSFFEIFSKYAKHSASGLLSTSVNFIVPILIIHQLGKSYSADIAFLSALVGLCVFIPRVIANEFIYSLQSDFSNCSQLKFYNKKILLISSLMLIFISAFINFYYKENFIEYALFSAGIISSQFSLAYSCVFSVSGKPENLLKVNFISSIFLVTAMMLSSLVFGFSVTVVLVCFICYQFSKVYFSKKMLKAMF